MRIESRSAQCLLLAGSLAAAVALLAVALRLTRPGPLLAEDLSELFVREVLPGQQEGEELILLQSVGGTRLIPVSVTAEEAEEIQAARVGEAPTGRLLTETVERLGGAIRAGILLQRSGGLTAVVLVERRGDALPIDASPGTAIAAALAAGRPILASPGALNEAGIDLRELQPSPAAPGIPRIDRPVLDL